MTKYRLLAANEIAALQRQNCVADDWANITVAEGFTPDYVDNVRFSGKIQLGVFDKEFELPGGLKVHAGISHATLHNCTVADNVRIYNVHNYIANYEIGPDTCIENVNAILVDGVSSFGNGVRVAVMNEGGGREIPIFDGLSAHLAYVLTLYRHRPKMIANLHAMIDDYAQKQSSGMGKIGSNVRILNCGSIKNVRIGDCARIGGASILKNGSVNSNCFAPVHIGSGVKCNDFILSSGVDVSDSTLVSNCFVGQGCIMGKHYSALDSLFFSNCQGMHGEATAIFAGPYTVSHHKSSLLIAGMFSFLNAGSGSNQSNHMYKLGPIHQGVAERGAKTTSDSYLLWPAKVGAFTLVMGRHTKHSDTSDLPFSYLIENATESFLVPAVNLRSVGTIRDAQKWPKRDNRKDPVRLDQINFNLLSPYTIQKMWRGVEILRELQQISGENSEQYIYQNCRIRNSSLRKGISLYEIGIAKFLGNSLISRLGTGEFESLEQIKRLLQPDSEIGKGEWSDLAGLIAPKSEVLRLLDRLENNELTLDAVQACFVDLHKHYYSYEWTWALEKLQLRWGKPLEQVTLADLKRTVEEWKTSVIALDRMVYDDARKEFNLNSQTGFGVDGDAEQRYQDFEQVRGSFESNLFVMAVLSHIKEKSGLGDNVLARLNRVPEC